MLLSLYNSPRRSRLVVTSLIQSVSCIQTVEVQRCRNFCIFTSKTTKLIRGYLGPVNVKFINYIYKTRNGIIT
jgi:hypothetical protein